MLSSLCNQRVVRHGTGGPVQWCLGVVDEHSFLIGSLVQGSARHRAGEVEPTDVGAVVETLDALWASSVAGDVTALPLWRSLR